MLLLLYYKITEVFESVLSIQEHARNINGWPGSKHDIEIQKEPPEVFYKKGVLRNFAKFAGKNLCHNLFLNKVAGLRPETLLKKRLWHRCFSVNFVKFLRTLFLQTTSGRLLPQIESEVVSGKLFIHENLRGRTNFSCTLLLKLSRNFLHLWKTFYPYFSDICIKMGEERPLGEKWLLSGSLQLAITISCQGTFIILNFEVHWSDNNICAFSYRMFLFIAFSHSSKDNIN